MITLEKIDNIAFDWNKNGILYTGDFNDLCEAARRGVEADGELNATKHILEDYKKAHSQAAKWQQHYLERAEQAEAENKTQIVYRKHDQTTIEFVNNVIARKEVEPAALKENTMSSIEAMKAARDYLRGCTIYPQKLADDLDAAIKAAQPEYMCPNCVTPWKCNGPHIPEHTIKAAQPPAQVQSHAAAPVQEYAYFNKDKFAELIVRECAEVVTDAVDQREPASTYADKIKQHFGVEE